MFATVIDDDGFVGRISDGEGRMAVMSKSQVRDAIKMRSVDRGVVANQALVQLVRIAQVSQTLMLIISQTLDLAEA